LAGTIRDIRKQRPLEIIVADGGSMDTTQKLAGEADQLISAPRGRAKQMNAGAARARGDVLLFLHADCLLGPGALYQAETSLRRGIAAGCFTMRVAASGLLFRWMDWVASARVRLGGIIYGDQGLFVRRILFEQLCGFPEIGLLEDVHFSRRLRGHGRLMIAPAPIYVSARRWQRTGVLRQTIRNWTLLGLAVAGVHPSRLAALYPSVR
jgi:rSAM/selenodomain-associated transferase 2